MKKIDCVKLAIICSAILLGGVLFQRTSDAATTVEISKSNFPDKTIRRITKSYDVNKDGRLSVKEIKKIKKIVIGQTKITSFKGIEKFSDLEVFVYKGDTTTRQGVSLDLSMNKKIKRVEIGYKMRGSDQLVKTLNLQGCSDLEVLRVWGKMKEINLEKCTRLKEINLYSDGGLKVLDVSECKRLKILCVGNGPSLKQVKLGMINALRSLEISNCKNMEQLNISRQTNLKDLSVINLKKLKLLNIGKNVKLRSISLVQVPIAKLDLSKHKKLSYFHCAYTKLKKLDLSVTRIDKTMKDDEKHFACYDNVEVIFSE